MNLLREMKIREIENEKRHMEATTMETRYGTRLHILQRNSATDGATTPSICPVVNTEAIEFLE